MGIIVDDLNRILREHPAVSLHTCGVERVVSRGEIKHLNRFDMATTIGKITAYVDGDDIELIVPRDNTEPAAWVCEIGDVHDLIQQITEETESAKL